MSLHPSAKMVRSSTYSALMEIHNLPSSMMGIPAGPRSVPLLRFKHTSKWNSTVGKQHEPFTVSFETQGMPPEYGVKCEDFTFHSAARMAAVVVRGRDPVEFPTPRKKIQLRIVVGYTGHFRTAGGRFGLTRAYSGLGTRTWISRRPSTFAKLLPVNWPGGLLPCTGISFRLVAACTSRASCADHPIFLFRSRVNTSAPRAVGLLTKNCSRPSVSSQSATYTTTSIRPKLLSVDPTPRLVGSLSPINETKNRRIQELTHTFTPCSPRFLDYTM